VSEVESFEDAFADLCGDARCSVSCAGPLPTGLCGARDPTPGGLPVTLCRKILSLSIYPELNDTDVDREIASIRSAKLEGVEAPSTGHP
jgi:hypothetical protein